MNTTNSEIKKQSMEKVKSWGLNTSPEYEYRPCASETKGNCPHLEFNEYFVEKCSIDNIVQIRHFGCTPAKLIGERTS